MLLATYYGVPEFDTVEIKMGINEGKEVSITGMGT